MSWLLGVISGRYIVAGLGGIVAVLLLALWLTHGAYERARASEAQARGLAVIAQRDAATCGETVSTMQAQIERQNATIEGLRLLAQKDAGSRSESAEEVLRPRPVPKAKTAKELTQWHAEFVRNLQ